MRAVGLLAVALAAAAAFAQDPGFRGQATVNVVEVPVQVVDPRTGLTESGLRASDFVLLEDGREQPITNFAELLPLTVEVTAPDRSVDLVLVADLFLADVAERNRMVAGLSEWWRGGLPAGVRVSLVAYDGRLHLLAERTRDPGELANALVALGDVAPAVLEGAVAMAPAPSDGPVSGQDRLEESQRRQRSREFLDQLEARVQRVGAALSATMARFGAGDSRLVMVVFTPGVPRTTWNPVYSPTTYVGNGRQPLADLWNRVALEAADLGFSLFLCDLSGPRLDDDSEASGSAGASDAMLRVRGGLVPRGENVSDASRMARVDRPEEALVEWLARARRGLLLATAELTGGTALFDSRADRSLARVATAVTSGYSLGFTPGHSGDGRTHTLEVRVRDRPDLRVSHRAAYVDRPESVRQTQRLRADALFGADRNPLDVEVVPGRGSVRRGRLQVPVEIRIPYARLALIDRGDLYWGKVLISVFNRDDAGGGPRTWSQEQPITLPTERYARAIRDGFFSFKFTLEVERGQELSFGVQDLVGGDSSLIPRTVGR